jgi:integrase
MMPARKLKSVPHDSPQTKPHPDFPLYPHRSGQWAKKIRGKTYYFGTDARQALDRYNREKADLLAGRSPTPDTFGLTVHELVNRFLYAKEQMVVSGDIAPRTFDDYATICKRIKAVFGGTRRVDDLKPDDFRRLRADFARTHNSITLWNDINRARSVFKFGVDERLLEQAVNYGQAFDKPVRSVIRRQRQQRGPQMFTPAEIRAILARASPAVRAMTLLGLQGGLGNTDVAMLRLSNIYGEGFSDLARFRPASVTAGYWLDYPRQKTAVPRSFPLWPETVAALLAWKKVRPRPKAGNGDYLFVTAKGNLWNRKRGSDDPVSKAFAKVARAVGIEGGRGFYCLRRTFETVGGESRDQVVVDYVMGHAPATDDMAAVYRQMVSDGRVQHVIQTVHDWLFTRRPSEEAAGHQDACERAEAEHQPIFGS